MDLFIDSTNYWFLLNFELINFALFMYVEVLGKLFVEFGHF